MAHYQRALEIKPDYADARRYLTIVLGAQAAPNEAAAPEQKPAQSNKPPGH